MEIRRICTLLDGRAEPKADEAARLKTLTKYKAVVLFLASLAIDTADVAVDRFGSLDARITHKTASYCLAGNCYGWVVIDLVRCRCILESSDALSICRRFRTYIKRKDLSRNQN